jgi:aminoglycoside phosphotransferase (APT) family kinase protein
MSTTTPPAGEPTLAAVNAWLAPSERFPGVRCTGIHRFDGGASNITCRLDIEGAEVAAVVLRLQRDRGIFEPYDVLREGRVTRALAASGIPVPAVLAEEPSSASLGAPFVVLEYVDAPHMGEAGPEASFPAFAAMVARIHGVDWAALGLDAVLERPGDAEAGLRAELTAIEARRLTFASDEPLLERASRRLAATVPTDGRVALCQGDINVFNYLFRRGEVVAVVDWEQARLSDPRSDLGQLVALSHLKGAPFAPPAGSPFIQLYGAAAGEAPVGLEWFRARWLWELGVIYHGWVAFNGSSPWYAWDHLAGLLEASLAELP